MTNEDLADAGDFLTTVINNCLETCILDWCKLFGEKKGEYHWSRVVYDSVQYEIDFLNELNISSSNFTDYLNEMKRYRDKFVAHLDKDNQGYIPNLDIAKASLIYHWSYLAAMDPNGVILSRLPLEPNGCFSYWQREAEVMISRLNAQCRTGSS